MAQTNPVTPEDFLADRRQFWSAFCGFTARTAAAVIVLLVLLAVFLL